MWHKALWLRNVKQGQFAALGLWFISLFTLSFFLIMNTRRLETPFSRHVEPFNFSFSYFWLFFIAIPVVILALSLVGYERKNGGLEFIGTLPYSATEVFLSKWIFGIVHILGITLVNGAIFFWIYFNSRLSDYMSFAPFSHFFLVMFIGLSAVYTVALLCGYLTGGWLSQFYLTFLTCLYPPLFLAALHEGDRTLRGFGIFWLSDFDWFQRLVEATLAAMVGGSFDIRSEGIWESFIPDFITLGLYVLYTLIALALSIYLAKKRPLENNGKFLLFPKLEVPLLWVSVVGLAIGIAPVGAEIFWSGSRFAYASTFITIGIILLLVFSKLLGRCTLTALARRLIIFTLISGVGFWYLIGAPRNLPLRELSNPSQLFAVLDDLGHPQVGLSVSDDRILTLTSEEPLPNIEILYISAHLLTVMPDLFLINFAPEEWVEAWDIITVNRWELEELFGRALNFRNENELRAAFDEIIWGTGVPEFN